MFYLINAIKGLNTKVIRRRPKGYELDQKLMNDLLWVCEHKNESHPDIPFTYNMLTEELVSKAIEAIVNHINKRYDCADFRMLSLLKFKLEANDFIINNPSIDNTLKSCFLNFKFWIKQEGHDSMCYYSENHSLSFATIEYILGSIYEDEVFLVDHRLGIDHQIEAKKRLLAWFDLKEKYGYSEFYSNNYLPITLAVLSLIIRYINDKELVNLAKKETDKIIFDYSSTLFDYSFCNATSRDYPSNLMNVPTSEQSSYRVIESLFKDKKKAHYFVGQTNWLFTSMLEAIDKEGKHYYIPNKKILELANKEELEIKAGFGLDLKDYKKEGLNNLDDRSLIMQLGSGALTNPEVINNTINMVRKYDLWQNDFLSWIRFVESPLLKVLGLMPITSKIVNYHTNGMALQRANVYTYRNKYYKLSCLQNYYPYSSGAQKQTILVTLPKGITVFTNHPIRIDKPSNNAVQFEADRSPSYFGGYGIAPSAFANKNVALVLYKIPCCSRLFNKFKTLDFTHAFVPEEWLDKVIVEKNYCFIKKENTYLALIGKNEFEYKSFDGYLASSARGKLKDKTKHFDLVQKGKSTFWIYELSSSNEETFEQFISRIKQNKVLYKGNTLIYESNHIYKAKYNRYFEIDNNKQNIIYKNIDIDSFLKENEDEKEN